MTTNLHFDFNNRADFDKWNNLNDKEYQEWRNNVCTLDEWKTLISSDFLREALKNQP